MMTCKIPTSLLVFLTMVVCHAEDRPLPRFTVNLDLPADERWVAICNKYSQYSAEIAKMTADWLPEKWRPSILAISTSLENYLPQPYVQELKGVSKGLNLSLGDVFLANIRYEVTAYCTSIVVQNSQGNVFHGRNFDYGHSGFLQALAMEVDFVKDGKVLYTGTTFAGYVGLVTGRKPGVFAISLDERNHGSKWLNLIMMITGKGKIVSLFIRDMLESAASYNEAVTKIRKTDFIASSYLIVSGIKPGDGCVITKGRLITVDVWRINKTRSGWFLVETNYDHWTKVPERDDRRHPAIKMLQNIGRENISPKSLFHVMSTYPVLNEDTAYTTIMSAKFPDIYFSVARNYTRENHQLISVK